MTEQEQQERVDRINVRASVHLQSWLRLMEEDPGSNEDELLSQVYGGLVALEVLGYSAVRLAEDAHAGANRLKNLVQDDNSEQKTD